MTHYGKVKKNRIDYCNICRQVKELTWEHVPPQCCDNHDSMAVRNIFDISKYKDKLDSQNGVKYRTICKDCNSVILGRGADPELKKLYEHVKDFIEDPNNAGKSGCVEIDLIALLKCVFGKLLAMDDEISLDKPSVAMREFILNNVTSDKLHVYFRLYPYKTTVQARTILTRNVLGGHGYGGIGTAGLISVLYFYPLAFVISTEEENIGLFDIMQYVDFNKPKVNFNYSPISAYSPTTRELLPHDWLVAVGDGKHDFALLGGTSKANIGIRRQK